MTRDNESMTGRRLRKQAICTKLQSLTTALLTAAAYWATPAPAADQTAPAPAPDATCSDPVYMVVSGLTLDGPRMGAYAAKLAETGIYAEVGGYYLNAPRPVAVFEGDVDPLHATLIVRFPCLENARRFWNSRLYQETIKPLRLDPPAGDYTVTVYAQSDLPDYMRGKVESAPYRAGFPAALEQVRQAAPPR